MTSRRASAARLSCLGVVLIAAVTACGGGTKTSSQALFRQAASKTRRFATVRFAAVISVNATGAGGSFRLTGTGASVQHGRVTVMDATFHDLHTGAGVIPRLRLEMILRGKDAFFRYASPRLAALMPPGKRWIVTSGGAQVPDLGQNDPAQMVSYLGSTSAVRLVGSATVRGVAASHFAGALLLDKVRKRAAAAGQAVALFDQAAAIGLSKIPIDAWIDHAGLLRRIRVHFGLTNPQHRSQKLRVFESADFYGYGDRIVAQLPRAREVITLAQFERHAASK